MTVTVEEQLEWESRPGSWTPSVMAHLDMGVCPSCGRPLFESSPGWARCLTSFASGPRSTGSDPIEFQIRDGRWINRRCTTPQPIPSIEQIRAVPPGIRPMPWEPIPWHGMTATNPDHWQQL